MKKKGFTLIELLVVISIIALLLSILMPALSRVKEQARTIVCQSSLKQFGIANALYASENNDMMPHPTFVLHTQDSYASSTFYYNCRWHDDQIPADGPIWPYLDSKNITRCPTFASVSATEGGRHFDHDPQFPINPQFGYVMNAYIMLPETYKDPWPAQTLPENWVTWKLSNIPYPSKVAIFCEENPFEIPGLSSKSLFSTYFMPLPLGIDGLNGCIATFHRNSDIEKGVSNISFADGHVGHEDGTIPGRSYELTGKYIDRLSP